MTIATFTVGKTYTARSACDHNCVWSFKVVSRTAKSITIEGNEGTSRRGVSIWDGGETAFPMGRYSMAPIIRAAA
jgi:hypothetical protein